MDFPKIDLVLSTDELRPTLSVCNVNPDYTYATDGHCLVRHDTDKLFDESFVAGIPKEGILITAEAIKLIRQKVTKSVHLINGSILELDRSTHKIRFELLPKSKFEKFPDYESVIPKESAVKPVATIGLNPDLLRNLHLAMAVNPKVMKLNMTGIETAILCVPKHEFDKKTNPVGLIMPVDTK